MSKGVCMKKIHVWVAAFILVIMGCMVWLWVSQDRKQEKKIIRVGITLYRGDDSFINTLRSNLEEQAKEYERKSGIKVVLGIVDSKGNQNTQNSQVERFISLGYDAICVNIVDRSMASNIIGKAMDADIPVVFFNREPVGEDMHRWEKLYYVGEDAKESATLQGNILVQAYQENPEILDLNLDGKVGYVLLEGETSHQDSLIRTEWSVETLKNGDVPIEKITGGIANWDRSQASALMEQWLFEYGDEIELVICNNDDMALGASDAMERNQIKRPIKLVGIDGTPQGVAGVRSGKLFGTVQCDCVEYANVIFEIAAGAALGQQVQEKIALDQGKYYQCSQIAITEEKINIFRAE